MNHDNKPSPACQRCGTQTHNIDPRLCLPCLFELNGFYLPDFAVDRLFFNNEEFSTRKLLAFLENLPVDTNGRYTTNSFLSRSTIINVCEQIRERIKDANPELFKESPEWLTTTRINLEKEKQLT